MTESTAREISKHLSHLQAAPRDGQEMARRFDLLILQLQLAHISKDSKQKSSARASTALALQVKENIPSGGSNAPHSKRPNRNVLEGGQRGAPGGIVCPCGS